MLGLRLFGSGGNENVMAQVDSLFQALRVSLRPVDYTQGNDIGGHYYFETATGALTGVGANGPIASIRNGDSKFTTLLLRLSLWYYITTAYTTAQMNDFELIRATGWTVADTGGTIVTPAKKRNEGMAAPKTSINVATTAALSAGTRTIDSTGVRVAVDGPPNVAIPTATLAVPRTELPLYDFKEHGGHPLALDYQEGLIVRAITAMGAVGVVKAYVAGEFIEVPASAFSY